MAKMKEGRDNMSDITTAKQRIMKFVTSELSKNELQIKLIKITKTESGWNGKVEITEDNLHLKKLGYPPVFDKNVYVIDLDDTMNVTNFCRQGEEF